MKNMKNLYTPGVQCAGKPYDCLYYSILCTSIIKGLWFLWTMVKVVKKLAPPLHDTDFGLECMVILYQHPTFHFKQKCILS